MLRQASEEKNLGTFADQATERIKIFLLFGFFFGGMVVDIFHLFIYFLKGVLLFLGHGEKNTLIFFMFYFFCFVKNIGCKSFKI